MSQQTMTPQQKVEQLLQMARKTNQAHYGDSYNEKTRESVKGDLIAEWAADPKNQAPRGQKPQMNCLEKQEKK